LVDSGGVTVDGQGAIASCHAIDRMAQPNGGQPHLSTAPARQVRQERWDRLVQHCGLSTEHWAASGDAIHCIITVYARFIALGQGQPERLRRLAERCWGRSARAA
jgi:hypothetical protein